MIAQSFRGWSTPSIGKYTKGKSDADDMDRRYHDNAIIYHQSGQPP
jgi:hypothetical protein